MKDIAEGGMHYGDARCGSGVGQMWSGHHSIEIKSVWWVGPGLLSLIRSVSHTLSLT